jgi:hypothetical protein
VELPTQTTGFVHLSFGSSWNIKFLNNFFIFKKKVPIFVPFTDHLTYKKVPWTVLPGNLAEIGKVLR